MMGRPLNQFVLTMTHRRLGHVERAVALLEESIRLCEEMESRRIDGAVPNGIKTAITLSGITP